MHHSTKWTSVNLHEKPSNHDRGGGGRETDLTGGINARGPVNGGTDTFRIFIYVYLCRRSNSTLRGDGSFTT
ncbi:hypothetical protein PISMIDRAFT_236504 [Pisolithus microcarpus 441]|uniref:Uncharacterized protein n=1 Tax=Pisolithus microcarpus 441 TaxID=765257 RepID=A0A0C9Z3T1_9AGAM|nr:hypothetical protein PISMIDRAFT_236504 [Pisolithus microcarpus 441]